MRIDLAGRILPGIAIALTLAACANDAPTGSELSPGEVSRVAQIAEDSIVVPVPDDVGKSGTVCLHIGDQGDPDRVGDCVVTPSLLGTLKLFYTASSATTPPTISGCAPGQKGAAIYIPAVSAGATVRAEFVSEGSLPSATDSLKVPSTSAKSVSASACR